MVKFCNFIDALKLNFHFLECCKQPEIIFIIFIYNNRLVGCIKYFDLKERRIGYEQIWRTK